MALSRLKKFSIIPLTLLMISACGGGGGFSDNGTNSANNSNAGNSTTTQPTPIWTRGVFLPESTYKDQCQTPRTGIDSFTGKPYPDKAGSSMQEKMWLRSWSDNTYLWYNEINDNNPVSYTVADYFAQLKTNQRTDSNALKDNFHFSQSTAKYNSTSQSGVVSDYGIEWEFVKSTSPRKLIVSYTEQNSPADKAGVIRGLRLTKIDEVDFVNTNSRADIDIINDALFPSDRNQTHTFTFIDPNNNNVIIAKSLTSTNLTLDYVPESKVISTEQGDIAYIRFNAYNRTAQADLIAAFTEFSNENVADLIIDLRYNGGGLLAMSSQLAYMVAGQAQTNNVIFETSQFNNKHQTINPITKETLSATPFYDKEINWEQNQLSNNTLPSLNLARVYVLTSSSTCSASEAFINGLRGINVEVIQIGGTTCGKPYGFYPQDNCGTTYFTVQFKGVNNKGFGEYSDGFSPTANPQFDSEIKGCSVNDDFTKQLGDENEAMLASALYFAETGSCLAQTQSLRTSVTNEDANDEENSDSIAIKSNNSAVDKFINNNKVYVPLKNAGDF